jgi:hypothetical protein
MEKVKMFLNRFFFFFFLKKNIFEGGDKLGKHRNIK